MLGLNPLMPHNAAGTRIEPSVSSATPIGAMCAAIAAFHRRVKVGHVEAGLRSYNRHHPFPEEANRLLTDALCDLYFAPTTTSRKALLKENIPALLQAWWGGEEAGRQQQDGRSDGHGLSGSNGADRKSVV